MAIPSIAMIPSGYKASKLYSVLPTDGSGDLTVVRAGATPDFNATRVNSEGLIESVLPNVPRLDYTDGGCPSLLVEPQSTNLALRSEEFDNAGFWSLANSGSISTNTDIAPDGTTTADRLVAGANFSQVQCAITGTADTAYTGSIYIKRITGSGVVNLRVSENADIPITVTNEWTRVSATVTSTTTTVRLGVKLATSGDEVAIWGAQLEQGSYPTSYIPTVASTVTRNADVISKTGLSSYINSSEGVLYYEAKYFSNNIVNVLSISDGTNNNQLRIGSDISGSFTGLVTVSGVTQAVFSGGINSLSNYSKIALKYKNNDFSLFVNGVKVAFDISGVTFPVGTLSQLKLDQGGGSGGAVANYCNLKNLQVYKTALTDQELITLTTL
jgi:hypothetical protein